MILIVVKFRTLPDWTERWLELVAPFTAATRAEPGNKWFEWSRSVDDPCEFVLVEAFEDDAAEAHVTSDHFSAGLEAMRPALAETPHIVSQGIDQDDWNLMGELQIG
ncbi:antibiotic biosynthesis monooxygenase [Aeromicrobium sp. A1-2]|uniref:putative quinol monooxygenase n=1 Tax=Aeromicrobium sp. A1-2 TaxID=2107713 RepID=UPI000E47F7DB|nr:putative quinol monooxygenase [Aeromicrobium sp. A1-2]AXT85415.1 antibiotic biosynthesis monooxygenase [Aeromicrobium sp. A1-2]